MKRFRYMSHVIALLLGTTIGCTLTLLYTQQLDLSCTRAHYLHNRDATTGYIVEKDPSGCLCGDNAILVKDAARKTLEDASIGEDLIARLSSILGVPPRPASDASAGTKSPVSEQSDVASSRGHDQLLIAILTSPDRINRSSVAYETWGIDTTQVALFLGNSSSYDAKELRGLPFVVLDDPCETKPKRMFKALKYIHNHFSRQYNWFLIVSDNVYVRGQEIEKSLTHMDPNEELYIGLPAAGRKQDAERLQLLPHERYCMGGPGVILSRTALQSLSPHLDLCMEAVDKHNLNISNHQWYNEDVELGRCLSRKVGIQCSSIHMVKNQFYEDYGRESMKIHTLQTNSVFKNVLTVHPVTSSQHMLTLHHFYKTMAYHDIMKDVNKIKDTINELCNSLPQSICKHITSTKLDTHCPSPGFVDSTERTFYPRSRYHIAAWEYFDPSLIYVDQVDYPSYKLKLHRRYHQELQRALLEVVKVANLESSKQQLKLKRLVNGYVKHDNLYGNEYIVDAKFEVAGNTESTVDKRIHIQRLFATNFIAQPSKSDDFETVHFIVPVSNVGERFTVFLQMYEEICLSTHENTHLTVVTYGNDQIEHSIDAIKSYQEKYPFAKFSVVEGSGEFSRAKALDLGISQLHNNDLIFLCDVDMLVKQEFLTRCRRNTIQGKQVYYPEFFKLYNMDYVYWDGNKPSNIDIKRQHGHWAYYSFGMVCIYKSDYKTVGGFDTGITGWGGEDVELYEKILRRRIEVFRSPDPGLTHRWHPKICSKENSTLKQYKHCLSSQGENLADRLELAQYILQQEQNNNKDILL